MGIVAALGVPALLNTLNRNKLDGSAREAAVMMQAARFEAIKLGVRAGVTQDFAAGFVENALISFVDLEVDGVYRPDPNGNGQLDVGEDRLLGRYGLPRGVAFAGPGDRAGNVHTNASTGFDEVGEAGTVLFTSDGSAVKSGAFRFSDSRGNCLEARVEPRTTARIFVQKYDGPIPPPADPEAEAALWLEPGEGGSPWEWN
jgi:type II secretion system GspH-like protein